LVLDRTWTPVAKIAASSAWKALKREVDAAKATWVRETTDAIQPPDDGRPGTPKAVRDAIRLLLPERPQSGSEKIMTPEENHGVMVGSLRKTFAQVGVFNPQRSPWLVSGPSGRGWTERLRQLGSRDGQDQVWRRKVRG
jgi:hypothetical protein